MNVHSERLQRVRSRIASACADADRNPSEITLLAVSKTHSAESLGALHELGQRSFGENRLAEALKKQTQLATLDIEWHFIGSVQSRKTRDVAANFDWVQSVDREKILRRLAAHRPPDKHPLNILLQVNIDREPQKSGCSPDELGKLAELAASLKTIKLRGLMCIPRFSEDMEMLRNSFAAMRELFDKLQNSGYAPDTLSMGMSGDLEAAIAEGSTMIRVGTDLFGPRRPQS